MLSQQKKCDFLLFFFFAFFAFFFCFFPAFIYLKMYLLITIYICACYMQERARNVGGFFFRMGVPPVATCSRWGMLFPQLQHILIFFWCCRMSPGAGGSQGEANSHGCYTQEAPDQAGVLVGSHRSYIPANYLYWEYPVNLITEPMPPYRMINHSGEGFGPPLVD